MAFEEEKTKWHNFLEKLELEPDNLVALKNYVDLLLEKNTPIILNPEHLSKLLGIRLEIIQRIVYSANSFYYNFKIPKKSGGFREISTPYPVLISAQKWIFENILTRIAINKCATGFVRNKSIIDNVKCHLDTNELLKMDIVDFFPSITFERIMSIFINLDYPKSLAYYLTSLCCLDGKLPQGAPTSPILSNIIAKRLCKSPQKNYHQKLENPAYLIPGENVCGKSDFRNTRL
jgi:retron-type reverse transcriptase